ncbi:hypothetical protein [Riemerella columbipharyngis]|uniref:Putative peptide zinc metalloprotease protein n=1 Tax=Riemerella columbipharyngis TaxID=1071918 RepID=A0A1G7FRB9_9FLAO|nr:hypothetical protein [Riemerella columbipharyngis]SDE78372.1 putative peptide zinc metalloprotease protein [Riemerella columbipharyngis]
MNYKLIKTKETPPRYILESGDKLFSINDILFDILTEYNLCSDYEGVSRRVNDKYKDNSLTDSKLIEDSIKNVQNLINTKEEKRGNYIKNRIKIMRGETANKVYSIFSFIFNKNLFTLCGLLFSIITFLFFYINSIVFTKGYEIMYENFSIENIIVLYMFFFVVIFLHEIGHAIATFSFGEQPKEIGFGMYFIFPVLYTDTTNIWKLKKTERIIVNLGGVYIQLIINVILMVMYYLLKNNALLLIMIISNTISIITSLNPFFRYDGYWIYSDLFQISNLKKKAAELTRMFFFSPRRVVKEFVYQKSLMLYSLLNFVFWIFVTIYLFMYLYNSVDHIQNIIDSRDWFSISSVKLLSSLIFVCIGVFNLVKNIKNS